MKVVWSIEGAAEIEKFLIDIGPRPAARAGNRALRAAARVIMEEAKRLVPVDTGELRDSLAIVTKRQNSGSHTLSVDIGFRKPTSRRAHFAEFGTVNHAAKPFMRPAMDNKQGEAIDAMSKILSEAIAKEAVKLPKKR